MTRLVFGYLPRKNLPLLDEGIEPWSRTAWEEIRPGTLSELQHQAARGDGISLIGAGRRAGTRMAVAFLAATEARPSTRPSRPSDSRRIPSPSFLRRSPNASKSCGLTWPSTDRKSMTWRRRVSLLAQGVNRAGEGRRPSHHSEGPLAEHQEYPARLHQGVPGQDRCT